MAKRKKTPVKYMFRRFVLVLLILALVGGGGWYIGQSGILKKDDAPQKNDPEQTGTSPETMDEEEEVGTEDSPTDPAQAGDAEGLEADPEGEETTDVVELLRETEAWNLLVVSRASPLPENFSIDLEVIWRTDERAFEVDARIAEQAIAMFNQARLDGVVIFPCSTWRSVEYQAGLFSGYVEEQMAQGLTEEEAIAVVSRVSADPGTSEHHTGLAIDIVTDTYQTLDEGFENTIAFQWLSANAHQYGFILRYPKTKTDITGYDYEPWHYRYVGVDHAAFIKENNLCLEEYVELLESSRIRAQEAAENSEAHDGEESAGEATE